MGAIAMGFISTGLFLLSRLTPGAAYWRVIISNVTIGLGMGISMPIVRRQRLRAEIMDPRSRGVHDGGAPGFGGAGGEDERAALGAPRIEVDSMIVLPGFCPPLWAVDGLGSAAR